MLRRFASALIPLLVLLVAVTPTAAQVITNDPNTGGNEPTKVEQQDNRLLQPVTYQPGYRRLHDVADELTKLTSVRISSGRNNDDWHVRDIPLVVCVKDMPLGRLLKMVAAAAHVQIASETVGKEDPTPVYRFARTREGEKELSDPAAAKVEANRKLASWAWDAMAAYGKMPDAPLEIALEFYEKTPVLRDVNGNPLSPDSAKLMLKELGLEPEAISVTANVIASLGPEAKAKLLAGEQLTVKVNDATDPGAMRSLIKHVCGTMGTHDPTEDEINRATLAMKLRERPEYDPSAGLTFMFDSIPVDIDGERSAYFWEGYPVSQARALMYAKGLKLPAMPDVEKILRDEDNPPGSGFELVKSRKDYEHPALQEKIKLDLPKREKRYCYAETLTAAAKAAGFDIICEDFFSHNVKPTYTAEDFDAEPTFASVIDRANRWPSTRWYLDKDNKLIVGYAREWREHHANLVPQRMLDDLHAKLEGAGAELDDVTPLVQLTAKQVQEWIGSAPQTYSFSVDLTGEDCAVWHLYEALEAEDKKLAKSEAGLPLAKFDPVWVSSVVQGEKVRSERNIILFSTQGNKPFKLADPELVKRLVMRVESEPVEEWRLTYPDETGYSCDWLDVHPQELGLNKVRYKILLTGEYRGEQIEITKPWHAVYFPMFTPEKELKLYNESLEKIKGKH